MNHREILCIEQASAARISAARERLTNLQKRGVPFESPLSGLSIAIDWNGETKEKIRQIFLMPIAFVLVFLLAILVPVAYIVHLVEINEKKKKLKKEIIFEAQASKNREVPKIKTLKQLWSIHGFDEHKYTTEERIELLEKWINILYGADMALSLNLEERVKIIELRHSEANKSYHKGEIDAHFFHFISPVDALIQNLSEELPTYA